MTALQQMLRAYGLAFPPEPEITEKMLTHSSGVLRQKTRGRRHQLIGCLLDRVVRHYGRDPFLVAAESGVSVTIDSDDDPLRDASFPYYSCYRPEACTIELYTRPLSNFWCELFPGCAPDLKYHFACWRELWHFWVHTRFASLKPVLGEEFVPFIEAFGALSPVQENYYGQYFAGLATGVIEKVLCEPR